jgi:hypothetical protein
MIRLTSVWILVLLAASPVATPFSACDLRPILVHGAAGQGLPASTTVLAEAAATRGDDAVIMSAEMSLCMPTDDSPRKTAAASRWITDAGAHARRGRLARSVRSLRVSATVLRL